MRLSAEEWLPCSINRAFLAFLLAERESIAAHLKVPLGAEPWKPLIEHPDLQSRVENVQRAHVLHLVRGPVLGELPPDTMWYAVTSLRDAHLDELRVIRCDEWIDDAHAPANDRRLRGIAKWRGFPLRAPADSWAPLVLWGHDLDGPFTIIEGNHRLCAYAAALNPAPFAVTAFVGVSPSNCVWHEGDAQIPLRLRPADRVADSPG